MSKELGQKIVIRFSEKITNLNETPDREFTVTGEEPEYYGGNYVQKNYKVKRVSRLEDETCILLTMDDYSGRFNNVGYGLTINYDANIGILSGRGGKVESFSIKFDPEGLVPKLNPNIKERIEVTADVSSSLKKVEYKEGYAEEKLSATAVVNIEFMDTSVINP